MGDHYIGEIRLFPYGNGKPPSGWQECNGQLLQITGNQALYALLGTAYGGDGKTTFGLPDLRGRAITGYGAMTDVMRIQPQGKNIPIGEKGGTETVALTTTQVPVHTHSVVADTENASALIAEAGAVPGKSTKPPTVTIPDPAPDLYGPLVNGKTQALIAASIGSAGGGAGHENRQPFLPLMYCIAVDQALFPPRN
ncbi:phage tail protein [Nitrospirillum iridis]|uniref:Microcystin-dependent protein n=1 Tax=Nitrospirillum iridis TaxID=765888 RepID=A0A7X0B128_9PROT|nr:tail fiber protein [Nitrospirillum iridis]MBB6253715.1 microcystin-dependent protein [Nitrospirillum iridis]